MSKRPDEKQEPVYLVEKSDRNDDFTHKATKIKVVNSISRTKALDVKVLVGGLFYEEGEELRAVQGNLKNLTEVKKFGKRSDREVRFNDSEMRNIS